MPVDNLTDRLHDSVENGVLDSPQLAQITPNNLPELGRLNSSCFHDAKAELSRVFVRGSCFDMVCCHPVCMRKHHLDQVMSSCYSLSDGMVFSLITVFRIVTSFFLANPCSHNVHHNINTMPARTVCHMHPTPCRCASSSASCGFPPVLRRCPAQPSDAEPAVRDLLHRIRQKKFKHKKHSKYTKCRTPSRFEVAALISTFQLSMLPIATCHGSGVGSRSPQRARRHGDSSSFKHSANKSIITKCKLCLKSVVFQFALLVHEGVAGSSFSVFAGVHPLQNIRHK